MCHKFHCLMWKSKKVNRYRLASKITKFRMKLLSTKKNAQTRSAKLILNKKQNNLYLTNQLPVQYSNYEYPDIISEALNSKPIQDFQDEEADINSEAVDIRAFNTVQYDNQKRLEIYNDVS